MRTKLTMSPPPVWGEMAKWVGELGSVARGWQVLRSKSRGQDGCVRDVYPCPLENTLLKQTNNSTNLNLWPMKEEKKKKKWRWVSETKRKNKPITVFCSISSIPASSSSFSSTSSKHWSLNLLLHPTQLRFLDLRSCTPCGILHEWYKK